MTNDTERPLEAFGAIPVYYGATGEPMVKLAHVRAALERQRAPEWIGADGVIAERLRQLTGFEGEASICRALEELEKLHQRRVPEGSILIPTEPDDVVLDAMVLDTAAVISYDEAREIWEAAIAQIQQSGSMLTAAPEPDDA